MKGKENTEKEKKKKKINAYQKKGKENSQEYKI
jgi:hypothetical protein